MHTCIDTYMHACMHTWTHTDKTFMPRKKRPRKSKTYRMAAFKLFFISPLINDIDYKYVPLAVKQTCCIIRTTKIMTVSGHTATWPSWPCTESRPPQIGS